MYEVLKRQRRKTMSQKKVDKYKNNKYSRNSALKKERAEFVLEMAAWILIAVLLVGWIGYSAYAKILSLIHI